MKRFTIQLLKNFLLLLCVGFVSVVNGQTTNSIDISSSQQNIDTAATFNAWIVTGMTDQMKNAVCLGNTDAWDCPSSYITPIIPVAVGANAILIDSLVDDNGNNVWPTGSYLSCFNANTIFTPQVTTTDTVSCAMTLQRKFMVYTTNDSAHVSFNFTVNADNSVNSIIIDAGTPAAINLSYIYSIVMGTSQATVDTTIALSKGMHTIDILAANAEQSPAISRYCTEGNYLQMNPFGVAISGTIASSDNSPILVNTKSTSINICSSLQNIDTATTFNAWIVTGMTDQMKNALCLGNSDAWDCPSSTITPIAPVAVGAHAILIDSLVDDNGNNVWPNGSYLSCFNANTIFTPQVATTDTVSCAMTLQRKFMVYTTNDSAHVSFNFTVNADNSVNSIIIDAGTPAAINLSYIYSVVMATSQVTVDTTIALLNGMHTIDIVVADGEQSPAISRYCEESGFLQLNPFGVAICGTITSFDNNAILVNTNSIVPVTYTTIKAWQQATNIKVQWNVANELNIKEYEIEKSIDGKTFISSGIVKAMGAGTYNWIDENVMQEVNYYRIVSIGTNGAEQYSQEVAVTIGQKTASSIAIYPNPIINGLISLRLNNMPQGTYGIRVTNTVGQTVLTTSIQHAGGSAVQTIAFDKSSTNGMIYFIEVIHPDQTKSNFKMMIE